MIVALTYFFSDKFSLNLLASSFVFCYRRKFVRNYYERDSVSFCFLNWLPRKKSLFFRDSARIQTAALCVHFMLLFVVILLLFSIKWSFFAGILFA